MTPTEELESPKSYHLQWNNHSANLQSLLQYHYLEKKFADVTLHCPDGHLVAHKLVLSSCSSYFESVLSLNPDKHASIILRDIPLQTLKLIVAYMYCGSVDIPVTELPSLLVIANELRIKGLIQDATDDDENAALNTSPITPALSPVTEIEPAFDHESPKSAFTVVKEENIAESPGLSVNIEGEKSSEDIKLEIDDSHIAQNMITSIAQGEVSNENSLHQEKQHQLDQAFQYDFTEERSGYPPDLFCSTCNRGFLNKQNMKRHMQTHTGVKPHQCSYCHLSFLRLSHLLRHHRVHTGERPFPCHECGKHFSRSDKLKQHISQHHSGVVISKQPKQRGRPRKVPVAIPVSGAVQNSQKISIENIDNMANIPSYQTLQQIYSLSVLQ